MTRIADYFSLIKFSHTVFALPFALVGFFLGTKQLSSDLPYLLLLKVTGCMVFARTAAMAFNRYVDREIDSLNERTSEREIPSGKLRPSSAIMLTIFSSGAFIATAYSINSLCFLLSPVALLVILGYSYTKRFTALCHFILGLGLSLAPIGAYLAVAGRFDITPLLFSLVVITWVSGFDIIYALQDDEFDRSQRLHSIPVAFGRSNGLQLARLLHAATAGLLVAAGMFGPFSTFYWIGTAVFGILLFYQHAIVSPEDLSRVNLAFFTTNGVASVVFSIFVIADLLMH